MTDEILNGRNPAGDARFFADIQNVPLSMRIKDSDNAKIVGVGFDEPESPDYPAWLDDDCGACGAPRDGADCTRCEGDA